METSVCGKPENNYELKSYACCNEQQAISLLYVRNLERSRVATRPDITGITPRFLTALCLETEDVLCLS